eukprot:m.317507 g.317507  ORF g.317507 m.317507 type:complete len:93 (+) comp16508_c0_seq4:304-582(+)
MIDFVSDNGYLFEDNDFDNICIGRWNMIHNIADGKYYERLRFDEREMYDYRSDIALSGNMVVVSRFDTKKVDGVYDGCIEIIRIPPQLNSSK